ncbi:MAG TPA: YetF domain-containing protein [Egibacteraceae bacterium]
MVVRGVAIYLIVFVLFRLSGRRTLAQITTFDFVLLLIVGEATQQGLLGDDFSVTNAVVVITTLIALDVAVSALQGRSERVDRIVDDVPLVVVVDGVPLEERLRKARLDHDDVMERARQTQGLERMSQIKYAVLERDGTISIIPR